MYHILGLELNNRIYFAVYTSVDADKDSWIALFKYNDDAHNYCKSAHDGSEHVEVDEQGGKVSYYAHPV